MQRGFHFACCLQRANEAPQLDEEILTMPGLASCLDEFEYDCSSLVLSFCYAVPSGEFGGDDGRILFVS